MVLEYWMLYVIAILMIAFRIYAMSGYKLTPFYDKTTGKFQLNVIGVIATGFVTAYPLIQATNLSGDPFYIIITTAATVYAIPTIGDKIGTLITPSPVPAGVE